MSFGIRLRSNINMQKKNYFFYISSSSFGKLQLRFWITDNEDMFKQRRDQVLKNEVKPTEIDENDLKLLVRSEEDNVIWRQQQIVNCF